MALFPPLPPFFAAHHTLVVAFGCRLWGAPLALLCYTATVARSLNTVRATVAMVEAEENVEEGMGGAVDGYGWDDDEWMRRIERAEDGDATASAVLALYDSLVSHDDVPSRGCG